MGLVTGHGNEDASISIFKKKYGLRPMVTIFSEL